MSARFDVAVQRPTAAQLICHTQALVALVEPKHLRNAGIYNALMALADVLGQGLTPEQVQQVMAATTAPPRAAKR